LRISGTQFAQLLDDAASRSLLTRTITSDLARTLTVAEHLIVIDALELGSLVVRFAVLSETSASPAARDASSADALAVTLQTAAQSSTWLSETSALYAVVSNETLIVTSAAVQSVVVPTSTSTTAPRTSGSGCSGQCMVFVLVTIAAGLAVVGAIIGVCLFLRRRRAARNRKPTGTWAPTDS
jgi:NADH:ubiquinone oxidoreductase subunit K